MIRNTFLVCSNIRHEAADWLISHSLIFFFKFSRLLPILVIKLELRSSPLFINFMFLASDGVTDEQLFTIMESICALVDSIPEYELIGLSCGNELLLKRAQRCVHLSG